VSEELDQTLIKLYEGGFSRRIEQERMIYSVSDANHNNAVHVLEGPTGIGKSYAYLIPLIVEKNKGKKIIVATRTKALQEQLITKDLPELKKRSGLKFSYTLAKGRKNYVCKSLLEANKDAGKQANLFKGDEGEDKLGQVSRMWDQLESKKWKGDLDQWEEIISDPSLLSSITTDRHGCLGKQCDHFDACPFYEARRNMRSSDVVVANHALLLADLSLGGGAVLPEIEDSIYVVDECHHLPVQAISAFASSTSLIGAVEWLESSRNAVDRTTALVGLSLTREVGEIMEKLAEHLIEAHQYIESVYSKEKGSRDDDWILYDVPSDLNTIGQEIHKMSGALHGRLSTIMGTIRGGLQDKKISSIEQKSLSGLGFLHSRAENLFETWSWMVRPDDPSEAPAARWVSAVKRTDKKTRRKSIDYIVQASPCSAADSLNRRFWDKIENGVILCSATIRSTGQFTKFLMDSGLDRCSQPVTTTTFKSPFNYKASTLIVPAMVNEPDYRNQAAHNKEVAQLLPDIIKGGTGSLVLFSSINAMSSVIGSLPQVLQKDILRQYSMSNEKLVEEHKRRVDAGGRSVIFGVDSFSEGVDLPGNYCTNVVIAKIPFSSPSDPVSKVYYAWLDAQGRNPFLEVSLPDASIKLIQGSGRLVRREDDKGTVYILDKRLVTRRYGVSLIGGLPGFSRMFPDNKQPKTSSAKPGLTGYGQ